MSVISASDVMSLRKKTGAGMMDCKSALNEAQGDMLKAIDILRKKGQKLALKRENREATEGYVSAEVTDSNDKGVLILIACETDFVAKNEDFQNFARQINQLVLQNTPNSLDELKELPFIGNENMNVSEKIVEQIGIIGEKIEIGAYETLEGSYVTAYNHPGNRLATLVAFNKKNDKIQGIARDIAMQIAAMNPIAVDKNGISKEVLDKELELGREMAKKEGKPEKRIEQIAMGKVGKFIKENTLLSQKFIKDNSKTVEQIVKLAGEDVKVIGFKRVMLEN